VLTKLMNGVECWDILQILESVAVLS
jgi:hypothetical protein